MYISPENRNFVAALTLVMSIAKSGVKTAGYR